VAFLGAIAVAAKPCKNTFVDCYLSDWTILLVEITYFLSIVSAFPIMVEVGRTRILDLFFGGVSNKKFMIFNSTFMVVATFFSIISPIIPLSTLISLVGAFFCYFFIYLIPSYLHFACLYGSPNK
jgi:solute carrier family 38 (sodium-coupled neutral amino acid transporter), member 9